jgi:hypothetical protein
VAVSLGGYDGKYPEWFVPADIVFSDCDWTEASTTSRAGPDTPPVEATAINRLRAGSTGFGSSTSRAAGW